MSIFSNAKRSFALATALAVPAAPAALEGQVAVGVYGPGVGVGVGIGVPYATPYYNPYYNRCDVEVETEYGPEVFNRCSGFYIGLGPLYGRGYGFGFPHGYRDHEGYRGGIGREFGRNGQVFAGRGPGEPIHGGPAHLPPGAPVPRGGEFHGAAPGGGFHGGAGEFHGGGGGGFHGGGGSGPHR